MVFIRLLAVATLLAAGHAARAEYILSVPEAAAHVGAPLRADLTILNDSDAPLRVELPAALNARLETERSVAQFDLAPDRSGALEIRAAPVSASRVDAALSRKVRRRWQR